MFTYQLTMGLMRPHVKDVKNRKKFVANHKWLSRGLAVMAILTISLGLKKYSEDLGLEVGIMIYQPL